MPKSTIVTLSNSITVANFSSPHDFVFEDGSILRAVHPTLSDRRKCEIEETELESRGGVSLISMEMTIPPVVVRDLMEVAGQRDVDFVIVPLMMAQAVSNLSREELPSMFMYDADLLEKVVSIRRRGRGGSICIDKFCQQRPNR